MPSPRRCWHCAATLKPLRAGWARVVSEGDAQLTAGQSRHSPSYSITKAQRLLGRQLRYTSLQAIYQSVARMTGQRLIDAARNPEVDA
jgi:hypothetical protein